MVTAACHYGRHITFNSNGSKLIDGFMTTAALITPTDNVFSLSPNYNPSKL